MSICVTNNITEWPSLDIQQIGEVNLVIFCRLDLVRRRRSIEAVYGGLVLNRWCFLWSSMLLNLNLVDVLHNRFSRSLRLFKFVI